MKPEAVLKECILSNIHLRAGMDSEGQETAPGRQCEKPARTVGKGVPPEEQNQRQPEGLTKDLLHC